MPSQCTKLLRGLNTRQHKFAVLVADDEKPLEAYKKAGYAWCDSKGEVKPYAKCTASRLVHNPKVAREIDRLRSEKLENAPGQGSHTIAYVRGEHLRQYEKLSRANIHGEAFKHLQALGSTLGAYRDGAIVNLNVLAVGEKTKQAALQIASVLTTGALPVTHEDVPGETNETLPMLSLDAGGKLRTSNDAKEVQSTTVSSAEDPLNPPGPYPLGMKLPPPTCIQNLGSPWCFGVDDESRDS